MTPPNWFTGWNILGTSSEPWDAARGNRPSPPYYTCHSSKSLRTASYQMIKKELGSATQLTCLFSTPTFQEIIARNASCSHLLQLLSSSADLSQLTSSRGAAVVGCWLWYHCGWTPCSIFMSFEHELNTRWVAVYLSHTRCRKAIRIGTWKWFPALTSTGKVLLQQDDHLPRLTVSTVTTELITIINYRLINHYDAFSWPPNHWLIMIFLKLIVTNNRLPWLVVGNHAYQHHHMIAFTKRSWLSAIIKETCTHAVKIASQSLQTVVSPCLTSYYPYHWSLITKNCEPVWTIK